MTEAEKIAGADAEDVAKDESMPPTSESTAGVSEDVEDVEDELSVSSESSEDRDGENWPAQERLARAESCKASGNEFFKKKENEEAVKLYAKGLKVLEKLWKLDAEVLDEDVRVQLTTLTVSLRLNSAVAQSREEKWKEARTLASKAMDAIRSAHAAPVAEAEAKKHLVKALFRRGVAYARMGDLDEAKADLVSLLKMDRTNKEAVREYNAVKQKLEKARADQQQQFAAAFQKASQSGGVYGDKEAERKRAALRKIEEERKRRDAWKKATEADGSQVPFEEWCKAEDKRIEEERKAKEAAEKAQREKEAEERRQRAREAREKREAEIGRAGTRKWINCFAEKENRKKWQWMVQSFLFSTLGHRKDESVFPEPEGHESDTMRDQSTCTFPADDPGARDAADAILALFAYARPQWSRGVSAWQFALRFEHSPDSAANK